MKIPSMNVRTRNAVLDVMKGHNVLTLATIRPDGYPQATTVTYANDGLDIYVGVWRESQKAKNVKKCPKVSLTIDRDYKDWMKIKGLSMAAQAQVLRKRSEIDHAAQLLRKKFPAADQWGNAELADVAFIKITPEIVSLLDYGQGFGHTELVKP